MSDFLSKITAPIPGESPFGADVNHDPDYERLKGEVGKLGDIDVGVVEALSLKILAGKSKDARALAFLAYAALRNGDIGRLADVFCALADYCEDCFDRLFPLREGAKLAALRWLSEARFTSRCPKVDVSVEDAEGVARLKEALLRMKPALEKRFQSSGAPFPHLLYKRVLEWERAVESMAASVRDDGDGAHQGGQPVDKSADKSIGQINKTAEGVDKSANKSVSQISKPSGGVDNRTEEITFKLNRGEYQEILHCLNKIETLLKKVA